MDKWINKEQMEKEKSPHEEEIKSLSDEAKAFLKREINFMKSICPVDKEIDYFRWAYLIARTMQRGHSAEKLHLEFSWRKKNLKPKVIDRNWLEEFYDLPNLKKKKVQLNPIPTSEGIGGMTGKQMVPSRNELLVEMIIEKSKPYVNKFVDRRYVELGFHSLKFDDYAEKFTELYERSDLSVDKILEIIVFSEAFVCLRFEQTFHSDQLYLKNDRMDYFTSYLFTSRLSMTLKYLIYKYINRLVEPSSFDLKDEDEFRKRCHMKEISIKYLNTDNMYKDVALMAIAICIGTGKGKLHKVKEELKSKSKKKYWHLIDRMRATTEKRKKQPKTQP